MYQNQDSNLIDQTQIDWLFPTRLLPKPAVLRDIELNNYELSEVIFQFEFSQEEKQTVAEVLLASKIFVSCI